MIKDDNIILQTIRNYYYKRNLKTPTSQEAILWAITELGEASDLLLMKTTDWVRNNEHERYSVERFEEELGDAIMMLVVAGWVARGDPIKALVEKIERKLYD